MKKIDLTSFFKTINYNYNDDLKNIEHICYYTKTRIKPSMKTFKMDFGFEQPFLLKALADYFKLNYFFEIGTGRGTASYSVALSKTIREVVSLDILPPKDKRITAIGYKKANVSNRDLYEKIELSEKSKVRLAVRKKWTKSDLPTNLNKFDFCFVDGEHDDLSVIRSDIELTKQVARPEAIWIFDDYCQKQFSVKQMVDGFLKINKDFNAILVETRGHIFDTKNKEIGDGIVICSRRKLP